MMFQERNMAKRTFAVRPSFGVHLEQTEIDAELDFFSPVLRFKSAHHHLARLVFPLRQQMRYIEIHVANMDAEFGQVNVRRGLKMCSRLEFLSSSRCWAQTAADDQPRADCRAPQPVSGPRSQESSRIASRAEDQSQVSL